MKLHKYAINHMGDDDLTPEETLADASSGYTFVELPIGRNVFRFLGGLGILVALVLVVQAFRLQVVQGSRLALLADQSRLAQYPIPSLRGIVYDANGLPLAENVPAFDLVAVRGELAKSGDPSYAALFAEHLDEAVFTVARDISKADATKLQAASHPGLYVVPYARRQYTLGSAFAHLLGYTTQVTADEFAGDTAGRYQLNDRMGRVGIEASYEERLHGDAQRAYLEENPTARLSQTAAGDDLTLYAQADIQRALDRAVQEVFRSAGVRRGAAVVQDVRTGAVLGMVSMPTFDPNLFEDSADPVNGERIGKIFDDRNQPLFNRVVSGLYSPGSTIKPLYALIGLREKTVTPATTIYADGSIQVQSEVDPDVFYTFRDWKVHGLTDIRKAIAWSVNVYFYALGGGLPGRQAGLPAGQAGYGDIRGLGIDRIERYLKDARADQKTGIDLPGETAGFVPSRAWKQEKKGEAWYVGDTYNISIGQGDLLLTPLWLNSYVSAIANGGNLYQPMVVKSIKDSESGAVTTREPRVLARLPFDDATFRVVREGMRQTVTEGTAQLLRDLPQPVAAKTGTAQVGSGKALNSLFVVYGPTTNPEIAMTVLVEQIPQSQSLGIQVAEKFFSWYFTRQ